KDDAVLTAGDNFYVIFRDAADPSWRNVFEDVYDRRRLPMPFFATLGNHDHEHGKTEIELAYARAHPESRWKIPSQWYRLDLPAQAGARPLVTALMLDSNKDFLGPD